ncbi:MAG: UbiA family prenyltransferase [Cyanobacteria bacterium P01_D01_bin.56]
MPLDISAQSFAKRYQALTEKTYRFFLLALVYPSIWSSAGLASLVLLVQYSLGLSVQWQPIFLIFTSALIPYNLDRVADSYKQKIPDQNAQAYFQQGWGWFVILIATSITAILLYSANRSVLMVSLGGLISLVYGLPLLPWRHQYRIKLFRLKDIPAAKAWIVAGIITYALIAVPLAYAKASLSLSAGLTSLFLFIFIGTNAHLFDVRDLESDRQAGVLTLPLLVGVSRNRQIWSVLNVLTVVLVSWGWLHQLSVPPPAVVIPCLAVNLTALRLIQPDTPRAMYNICLDGCLFIPGVIVLLANLI